MGFRSKSGTGADADRTAITKSARGRQPRPERRVTCRTCNGAGEVWPAPSDVLYGFKKKEREICSNCNGAGQVVA